MPERAERHRRELPYCAGVGLVVAVSTFVTQRYRADYLPDVFTTPAACILLPLLAFICGFAVAYGIVRRGPGAVADTGTSARGRLSLSLDVRSVAVVAAIILICWLPWIVIQYPCGMESDTYNQLYQFRASAPTLYTTLGTWVDAEYIDHHPVFDTLLFGSFLSLGDALGSQNVGLFLYSLFQSILSAGALGVVVCYLERLRVPRRFALVTLVFVCLVPVYPTWATTMVKDSLFAPLFLLFCIQICEVWRTRGGALSSRRFVVALVMFACLCVLTKKTGVYFVVPALAALLFVHKVNRRVVASALAVPLVLCCLVIPLAVYPLIGGVAKGGSQEALGMFYQQSIAVVADDADAVDAADRATLERVLYVDDAVGEYDPTIVDGVKSHAKPDATTADYLAFLGAYLHLGITHPGTYTDAVFAVCTPLIGVGWPVTYCATPEQDSFWVDLIADAGGPDLHFSFYKPTALEPASAAVDEFYRSVAVFLPFLWRGFFGFIAPLSCFILCLRRRPRMLIPFIPIILSVLVLFISPASASRYVLSQAYLFPLIMGLLAYSLGESTPGGREFSPKNDDFSGEKVENRARTNEEL